jgi:hypothetical protein
MPSPTAVLATTTATSDSAAQPGRLLDAGVGWLPAQPDVAAADPGLDDRPGGGAPVVEPDTDRAAGGEVNHAADRQRRAVEDLAELPLPPATSLPSISSRVIPAARTVKRCGRPRPG